MVILGTWKENSLTISVKANCLTISQEKPGSAEVFSYDYAGRLWTALLEGISYRRGLDGKMVAKWLEAENQLSAADQNSTGQLSHGRQAERRWLVQAEALQIEERARRQVEALYRAIQAQEAALKAPLDAQARLGFERAIGFDAERSKDDAARYLQVYRPVGILPPDQYMAIVLQATQGCAFNTCTFCDFYRDRPFRIKSPEEFRRHAEAVRDFVGPGMSLRRTIFLGDANALIVPMPRLMPLFDVVHQVYDVKNLGGIFAFLDGFSGEKKSPQDYRALKGQGLERVYIGMESGNAELLKFIKKPGAPADAVRAALAMKEGGLKVGVIVLLGAGGQAYAKNHVKDTIQALNAMHLDMDDIIYFSELVLDEGMQYVKDAYQAGLKPLTAQERQAQGEGIEGGLKFSDTGGVPHISRYDIREFVY